LRDADGTLLCDHEEPHELEPRQLTVARSAEERHEHEHGLIDRLILRSRAGIRAVSWSLAILTVTALAQDSSTPAR
jgi:hypothetical protein